MSGTNPTLSSAANLGAAPNFTQIVLALQSIATALAGSQQILASLSASLGTPPRYTTAGLPTVTTANTGQLAFATDARNTGQGAGTGTGALVFVSNAGSWACVWSGVAPTT